MFFSAYQIELLLEDFQKNILPVEKSSDDTLSISEVAYNESRQHFKSQKVRHLDSIKPENIKDLIEDKTTYDPIVDYVQQSRAGRFVKPNYIPKNPAPPFLLVSDFNQSEKKESPDSPIHNSSEIKSIETKEIVVNDVPSKGRNLDNQNIQCEETTSKLKNLKMQSHSEKFFKDLDDEEGYENVIPLSEDVINEDNDVVFGEGPILKNSISRFVSDYPDSAIKFLLRKNLDGRPLPMEYESIYQKWETRGLSRGELKKYLLKLMKWKEFPDIAVLEVLKKIREYLFDIREKKNENKKI